MDKKEWKIIDELRNKVQQISEQQTMKKKLANVKYVAVEFAYDHFKNGEDAVNDAIGNGYQNNHSPGSMSAHISILWALVKLQTQAGKQFPEKTKKNRETIIMKP